MLSFTTRGWMAGSLLSLACLVAPVLAASDANDAVFKTNHDKASYIIGQQFATVIKQQKLNVVYDLFLQGLRDALFNQPPKFTPEEERLIMGIEKIGEDNAWKLQLKQPAMMTFDANKDYFWILDTNKGTIRIKLLPDVAPMHVTSTIFLTNKGFYDGLTFHRVIPGFMAQGGCPVGDGTYGPGYEYGGEFKPDVKHDKPYRVSMANTSQPNSDGSQFFITFVPTPWLDGKHTIFGDVVDGQDVVKELEAAGTQQGRPKEKLVIRKATIEEKAK